MLGQARLGQVWLFIMFYKLGPCGILSPNFIDIYTGNLKHGINITNTHRSLPYTSVMRINNILGVYLARQALNFFNLAFSEKQTADF